MLKKSLIKVGLVGTGNVVNAILGFAYLTAIAKVLDLESFGKYALLASLLVFISRLLDFGTNSTFVSQYLIKQNTSLKKDFYASKILLFLIALHLTFLTIYFSGLAQTETIILFILGLGAYGINYTLFALFQKAEKYLALVMLNTLPAIIKGLTAFTIFYGSFIPTYQSAFTIFSLSIFSSAILWIFIPKEFKKIEFSSNQIKDLLTKSFPAGASQLITEGWPAFNNFIAKIARGFADVGIFSLANKISNIFALASVSIFTVLLPQNAARLKEKRGYDFKETGIMAFLILLLAIIAIFVAQFFLELIFGDKFSGSKQILNILIFASAFTAIHSFMENYFFVVQQTKYIFYINTAKLATFLVLGISLVTKLSLQGLALANLISAAVALIITVYFMRKPSQQVPRDI
jgi:O-antigen/teichoic acid export membrane protein